MCLNPSLVLLLPCSIIPSQNVPSKEDRRHNESHFLLCFHPSRTGVQGGTRSRWKSQPQIRDSQLLPSLFCNSQALPGGSCRPWRTRRTPEPFLICPDHHTCSFTSGGRGPYQRCPRVPAHSRSLLCGKGGQWPLHGRRSDSSRQH